MYDVDGAFPGADVSAIEPGTNLLVSGDTHRAHELTIDLLARGPDRQEAAVLVSTNESAAAVLDAFEARGALDPTRVGVVDCTAGDDDRTDAESPVAYLGSPGDLTGISLEFAKLFERLQPTALRVGLSSVSTLLMYTEVETTFRFVHVFCSRIRTGGWLGVFTIDPEMHDPEAVNTIRALFDCEAQLGEDDIEVRGEGFV